MAKDAHPPPAAMQGDGYYNRNSRLQAANLTSALPLLLDAVGLRHPQERTVITIADYGASQGRNSMVPLAAAVDALRTSGHRTSAIEIYHVDLPTNDFNTLFVTLANPAESYLNGRPNVYPAAIGRSYFEQILPAGRVDFGWSSNALHWMRGNPVLVPDHGWAIYSKTPGAVAAVENQLASDWRDFLIARASELREGGVAVCQFMGRGNDSHGFEWMADCWWQAILAVHREGLLSEDDILQMTCPSAGRSIEQIEDPFADGTFHGLLLDQVAIIPSPDPFWDAYLRSGNLTEFAHSWSTTMRAANGPSFIAGLSSERDHEHILDRIMHHHAALVSADPQPCVSWLAIAVIRKGSAT
ncbi:hypothetical protein [Novosphingobium aquae]|uniref:SAM-dependent methyltransferase n=1 Tax=Novosphingobium aquae TaxID=3133435 RepID=A0ABU8SAS4_9SPHN